MQEQGSGAAPELIEQRLALVEAELATLRAEMATLQGSQTAAAKPKRQWGTMPGASVQGSPGLAGSPPLPPLGPRPPVVASGTAAVPNAGVRLPAPETRSLENRIGSQVFNRVGIVALLIGVAWFLKLAIDNEWIGPGMRVVAGLLVGAGVVLWSERFRKKGFGAFSYSLKAVGTGVLYLALWASLHLYHLLPAPVVFAAMLGVTAWNATMALLQHAELLAAYALVGGMLTPALLSTGGNHEVFLFSYVLAIDATVLYLLMQKPWKRLLLGSFPGTAAYFIGWYAVYFHAPEAGVTALFAVLLAAPFVAVALVGKEREGVSEGVLTPLAAAMFLGGALYSLLEDSGRHDWLPWVAVAAGALYLLLMRARQSSVTRAVHVSLAIVFLTIAIPLKASGRWITVGWLAEGVALMWVSAQLLRGEAEQKVRVTMRALAGVALLLGSIAAVTDWSYSGIVTPIWNARFATEALAALSLGLAGWFAWTAQKREAPLDTWGTTAAICLVAFNLMVLHAGVREIATQFARTGSTDAGLAEAVSISAWMMVYAAALLAVGFVKRIAFVRWQGLLLVVVTIAKVFVYDMGNLSSGYRVLSFVGLGLLLMAVSFAYQKDWLGLRETDAVSASAGETSE